MPYNVEVIFLRVLNIRSSRIISIERFSREPSSAIAIQLRALSTPANQWVMFLNER